MNSNLSYTLRIAITVSLGGFIFGFDASVISGVIGFLSDEYQLGNWEIGLVVAAPTLAGIISGATAAPLSDRFGRKRILLIVAALYVISAICSAFAPNYQTLIVARFIGGLAFASLGLAPVYISEISTPSMRGRLVSINQLNIVVGFSAAYFANYMILTLSESSSTWVSQLGIDRHTWRWMLGLEILPALAYFLLLFTIPESPRWLVLHNRVPKARDIMRKLAGDGAIDDKIDEILNTSFDRASPVIERFKQLLKPSLKLVLTIGIIISIVQQITGINAIYFYAPSIFEQSGVGKDAAFSQAVWVGIINIIFTLIAMALIDRLGRKPLLMIGLSGIFCSMLLCSYGFYNASYQLTEKSVSQIAVKDSSLELDAARLVPMVGIIYDSDVEFKQAVIESLGEVKARAHESELIKAAITINPYIILAGILGFVASFAMSLGPVMWVLLPEIFPNHLRGVAMAVTGMINSLSSFVVQLVFPWELNTLGATGTFAIYAGFAAVSFIFVAYLLPETRGKSLEEIEKELGAKS